MQLMGRGKDEEMSAQWLSDQLRLARFKPYYSEVGRLMVIGSQPIFDDNGELVGQMASHLAYPDEAAEILGKGLASNDIGGEIFSPQGAYLAHQLYREITGCRPGENPPIDPKFIEFQRRQVRLMERYRFPLPGAEKILATHRLDATAYADQVRLQVERGEITDYGDLIAQDIAFMDQYS
jgi:hypothetical protein